MLRRVAARTYAVIFTTAAAASITLKQRRHTSETYNSYNTFFIDTNPSHTITTMLYPSTTRVSPAATNRTHRCYSDMVAINKDRVSTEKTTSSQHVVISQISGKLTFKERILLLADPGSFRERYALSSKSYCLSSPTSQGLYYQSTVEDGYINYKAAMENDDDRLKVSPDPMHILHGFGDIFSVEKYVDEKNINTLLGKQLQAIATTSETQQRGIEPIEDFSDGVIAGTCTIYGKLVYIYSTNSDFYGGTITNRNANKIVNLMVEAATNNGIVIGIFDSAGARIQEGILSLAGYGKIFSMNTQLSGLVPQISVIMGTCAGGSVYSPALSDFVFMVDNHTHVSGKKSITTGSQMFVTGPTIAEQAFMRCENECAATAFAVDKTDLGGAEMHISVSGVATCRCVNEVMTLARVRKLVSYIPTSCFEPALCVTAIKTSTMSNESEHLDYLRFLTQQAAEFNARNYSFEVNQDEPETEHINATPYNPKEHAHLFLDLPTTKGTTIFIDNRYRDCSCLNTAIPNNRYQSYNVYENIVYPIIDRDSFYEIQEKYAKNIVCGFARIEGRCVAIIANNSCYSSGAIDCNASLKASRVIQFANSYGIPIITFVDVPGFLPGKYEEARGIIKHGAKLLYAYANCTVPLITIYTGKAYGGAYIAMASKELVGNNIAVPGVRSSVQTGGAPVCAHYAWPTAAIAVMGQDGAYSLLAEKKIRKRLQEKYGYLVDDDTSLNASEAVIKYKNLQQKGLTHGEFRSNVISSEPKFLHHHNKAPSLAFTSEATSNFPLVEELEDDVNLSTIEHYLGQQFLTNYTEKFCTPLMAAQTCMVDSVIIPAETRMRICEDLERFESVLYARRGMMSVKKQGNFPI